MSHKSTDSDCPSSWFSTLTCQDKQQLFVNTLSVSIDFTIEQVTAIFPHSLEEKKKEKSSNFESCRSRRNFLFNKVWQIPNHLCLISNLNVLTWCKTFQFIMALSTPCLKCLSTDFTIHVQLLNLSTVRCSMTQMINVHFWSRVEKIPRLP